MYPTDLKYNEEHTWLKPEDNSTGRVGITDFAQDQLKEVVFIELPEVGTKVAHMEPFGVIESAKATNDLFSPVTGVVIEVNKTLEFEPNRVNNDPYGEGWMIIIEIDNPAELDKLIPAEQYQALVNGDSDK